MGGCHHTGIHFPAEFDDCHSQSCTLGGVRTGTQFVEQHQRTVITLSNHIHDGPHMGREGGQALGNTLFVADIRQNGIEGGQLAAVTGGNVQTALRHQGKQADGLQSYRLTAGIGAGDDHGIEIRAQADSDGHHSLGIDQGVPGFAQVNFTLVVHDGGPGPHPVGQLGLGENHIQLHQHLIV